MRRTSKTPSLRTGAHAGVAIRNTPTRRTSCSPHGRGSTLPMRCGIGKTGGAEPPPLRKFINFFCRAAPMCAAAETHRTICYAPVGGGILDAPPLTAAPPLIPCRAAPMCAAADHHRTFKTCHCEPVRTLVWQSVLSPRTPQLSPFRFQLSTIYFPPITSMSNPPCSTK